MQRQEKSRGAVDFERAVLGAVLLDHVTLPKGGHGINTRHRARMALQNATRESIDREAVAPQPLHQYVFIDSKELALRWNLPESWVREQVRARSAEPIPHMRFGKYVRFRWGSPELEAWAERRIVSGSNRVAGRALGKESR